MAQDGLFVSMIAVTLLLACSTPPFVPVFPGAEGFGTETPAGRGGKVIHVTNLHAYGPGSLREALTAEGPRIVVFDVSGIIDLTFGPDGKGKGEAINIRQPFLTVVGQTAPPPGIFIKGGTIQIYTHDILIQHLAIRVGDNPSSFGPIGQRAIYISGWGDTYNVVVDHCSLSWGIDDNIAIWPGRQGESHVHDVTISNCIISEGLHNTPISLQPNDSKGLLVGDNSKRITVIRNIFAHNNGRNPVCKGGVTGAIINNLVYNHGTRDAMPVGSDNPNVSPNALAYVGNVILAGPATRKLNGITVGKTVTPGTRVYQLDNDFPAAPRGFVDWTDVSESDSPPVDISSLTILPSERVVEVLKQTAGFRPAERSDALHPVDQRIIADIENRSGGIIDSPDEVGGWPKVKEQQRPFNEPFLGRFDFDKNGYTRIEEVLHQLARQVEQR